MSKTKKNKKLCFNHNEKNRKNGVRKVVNRLSGTIEQLSLSVMTSEASSSVSDVSGSRAHSSAESSNTAKKLQCDLCKLSYSSEKDLTEHLVSLMHHTKLENKDVHAVHECALCQVESKSMAEFRQHIVSDSHMDKIACLKGEWRKEKKTNHPKWAPKSNRWPRHPHNYTNNLKNSSSRPNSWHSKANQRGNINPYVFDQPPHPANLLNMLAQEMYEQDSYNRGTVFGYNNAPPGFSRDCDLNHDFYDNCYLDDPSFDWGSGGYNNGGPWRSRPLQREGQSYEPWGSGVYRSGMGPSRRKIYDQYGRRDHHSSYRGFQGPELVEDDHHGHWDEQSLCMQEEFLASMEEPYDGRGKMNDDRTNELRHSHPVDVSSDNQLTYILKKWGSGINFKKSNASTFERLQNAEDRAASASTLIDRKRPIQSNKREESPNSAAPKSFRSFSQTPNTEQPVDKYEVEDTVLTSSALPLPRVTASELDSASDNLLQRAERLCKELREKRLASAHKGGKKFNAKEQETALSRRLDTISQQRQQKYFKGIIRGSQDVSSGDRSGDSGISTGASSQSSEKVSKTSLLRGSNKVTRDPGSGQKRSLQEIAKSLEVSSPKEITKPAPKNKEKSTMENVGDSLSRGFQDLASSSASGKEEHILPWRSRERRDSESKQAAKPAARPQVFTKDSLKKIINAPNSRDKRVHLAKLLHSREDSGHKSSLGTSTSRPLQLEGLYDNHVFDVESATFVEPSSRADRGSATSTIKLEDLGDEVREQILALIGLNCPELELQVSLQGARAKSSTHQADSEKATVVSDSEDSTSIKKKPSKALGVKMKNDLGSDNTKRKIKTASSVPPASPKNSSLGKDSACGRTQVGYRVNVPAKTKSLSPEVVMIDLVNSEDEFDTKLTSSRETGRLTLKDNQGVKDVPSKGTPKKKKKTKQKEWKQDGEERDISSSIESDSASKQIDSSPKTFAGSVRSSPQTSKKSQNNCHKNKEESFLVTQPEPIKFRSSVTSLKSAVKPDIFGKKATLSQEQSLNSQNVRERFPILMNASNVPFAKSGKTSSPTTTSASTQSSTKCSASENHVSSSLSLSLVKSPRAESAEVSIPSSDTALVPHTASVSSALTEMTVPPSLNYHLPPSIHLARRSPQPSDKKASLANQPPECKSNSDGEKAEPKIDPEDAQADDRSRREKSIVVMDDADDVTEVAKSGEEDGISVSSSAYSSEASSQAMAELLLLSEREEQMKQEAMNMELRLTRLHRLLEQAVVQINKCTERRSQLLEEEKEISNKRLSLLRSAAKGKSVSTPPESISEQLSTIGPGSESNAEAAIDSVTLGRLATAQLPPASSPATGASAPAASMSRADWLAKFSSFLPPDPALEKERQVGPLVTRSISAPDAQQSSQLQCVSLGASSGPRPATHMSPRQDVEMSNTLATTTAASAAESSLSMSSSPAVHGVRELSCMYVGSFRTPSLPTGEAISSVENHKGGSGILSASSIGVVPLPEPGAIHYPPSTAVAAEDSDIGSVASSLASGASLGEQISQYCRAIPGASLDRPSGAGPRSAEVSRHLSHDLSVILSSDASLSDHHSENNLRGREEEGHQTGRSQMEDDADGRSAYNVISQKSEDSRKCMYGSLNEEAVRSAEALHVMERNYQEELKNQAKDQDMFTLPMPYSPSKASSVSLSDVGGVSKRKKLLTRQEREASQLTRHRKRWLVHSSSSDEEARDKGSVSGQESALVSPGREKRQATDKTNVCFKSDQPPPQDDPVVVKTELLIPKQETQANIVVAECDSSTNLGIVDSESICERTKTLREMRQSFEKTFGRSPRSKIDLTKESGEERESNLGVNSTTADSVPHEDHHLSLPAAPPVSLGSQPRSRQLICPQLNENDFTTDIRSNEAVLSARDKNRDTIYRSFEGNKGLVCEMQVVDGHLYVGYQNIGISVFDLHGPIEEKISEHAFSHLECFYVTEISQSLTVVVGNGSFLVLCCASDIKIPPQDMGTPIRCLLCSDSEIFLGLDTGEICVVSTKTFEKRWRFICSDHPLCSLALAQEGTLKLLCVSAQDGSISVVNSRQGLLLRILSGHRKAASSLQVDKSSVFSGSADGTVMQQNLNTTTVEHKYSLQSKGAVMAVHLYGNYLLTGGSDKLVRCYDVKTHKLVQVNYGAGKGVISKIIVHDNKLITGNSIGTVEVIDFKIDAQNKCPLASCGLNFGHPSHLQWHKQEAHHFSDCESAPIVVS